MPKGAKENIIVVCTIVLCFMLTIGLCSVFSGDGIIGVFSAGKDGSGLQAYALAVGGYWEITFAGNASELVKGRGGAG